MSIAFKIQHHVHKVLQHPGASDVAIFCHMSDQKNRNARVLGQRGQCGGDGTGLRHPTGHALYAGRVHGLHRVHDEQRGFQLLHVPKHHVKVGFRCEKQRILQRAGALRTHTYLPH